MEFRDFIQRLASVIRAGGSTSRFTRSVFEAILTEDGLEVLDEYKSSSYKSFYNGGSTINRLSKKINAYIEPMNFADYIHQFSDAVIGNLCNQFKDVIPDIDLYNAGDLLAELFVSIITTAAGTTKRISTKEKPLDNETPIIMDTNSVAPEVGRYEDGILYVQDFFSDKTECSEPFHHYIEVASSYYSTKKTLLYAEKPHPFYDMYVCNNIQYRKYKITGIRDLKPEKIIENATIDTLEKESKYIIIEGTGGIGKSMFLTHLFLSSAQNYNDSRRIPLLMSLKDYRDDINGIVDFIWKSVRDFDPTFSQSTIIDSLEKKRLVILMDGLDEIQTSARDSFDTDLEAFIKSYPGNIVVITSRPIYSFIAYSKFSVFEIKPLEKYQAIKLIKKLEFWDKAAQNSFIDALDNKLYDSHYQFASNPLLLTIMLMTYSSFGEVPAKMHVFYSKAFETMARLHDATKGSYKRPLYTKLTPEEIAKYFSEFCARTYKDEVLEFTDITFSSYMNKVLNNSYAEKNGVTSRDFLLDLTDNLCVMYHEGEEYFFIHRSFQEYFAAVFFASGYDTKLYRIGHLFESMENRSFTDRTFDMLYDMIPEKVERYIFLPFLEDLFNNYSSLNTNDEYWNFIYDRYRFLYYNEGYNREFFLNEPRSFIYKSIVKSKHLSSERELDELTWPDQIYDLGCRKSFIVYENFSTEEAFNDIEDINSIDEELLKELTYVFDDELPYSYDLIFGDPEPVGMVIEIDICKIMESPTKYSELHDFMEQTDFPFFEEYQNVKKYYTELKESSQKEDDSEDLFDD